MRIGTLLFCAIIVAGCSRISGGPAVPSVASSFTAAKSERAAGAYLPLYSFRGDNVGANPQAGLVAVNGVLYGTTPSFGAGYGTVFSLTSSGKVKVLHSFHGYPDGAYPEAGLVFYKNALYGTTNGGGAHEKGAIFAVTLSGAEHVVHSFGARRSDGAQPQAGLVVYNGVLYGTTRNGGLHSRGTVFEVTPGGTEEVMHSFAGAPNDGGHPTAGLIFVKGEFYGVTRAGGESASGGAAFKIDPFGGLKILHSFGIATGDGSNPAGGLVYVDGTFYGTTLRGGDVGAGYGTVFAMNSKGVEGVIHSFGARADGAFPLSSLLAFRGKLYGTTMGGGVAPKKGNQCLSSGAHADSSEYYKCGTIFEITPFGDERVVHRFTGDPDGANPEAGLLPLNGILYGTTYYGGTNNTFGTLFRLFP